MKNYRNIMAESIVVLFALFFVLILISLQRSIHFSVKSAFFCCVRVEGIVRLSICCHHVYRLSNPFPIFVFIHFFPIHFMLFFVLSFHIDINSSFKCSSFRFSFVQQLALLPFYHCFAHSFSC